MENLIYKIMMDIVEEKDRILIDTIYQDMLKNKEKYPELKDIDEILVIGREGIKDLLSKGIQYEKEHKGN